MTTMAYLKPGIRVRHIHWDMTGTIQADGDITKVRWDAETVVVDEISDEDVVTLRDIEIIGAVT